MVQNRNAIKHMQYDDRTLLKLQRKFLPAMINWRRGLAIAHKCSVTGCYSTDPRTRNVYRMIAGDGIRHLTRYV